MERKIRRALCSGSFDPVTNGHVDVFERAAAMVDELVICVFHNIRKQSFFSVEERVALIREATQHIQNVRVDANSGLIADYMKEHDIPMVIRGLRSVTDFEYEQKSAQLLHALMPGAETIFLLTSPAYSFINSSGIRELAAFGRSVAELVPPCVEEKLLEKIGALKKV